MLFVTHIQYSDDSDDPVGNLFTLFGDSFSHRTIAVNEVRTMFTDMRKNILCLKVQQ
jgi:hypothetical protein